MTGADRIPPRYRVTTAVRRSKLPAPAKLVMLVLADVADVGTAEIPPHRTPSLTQLTKETGLSRSTVAAHLLALEEAGWVVRTRPTTAEALGQWERTRYQLRVPADLVQELDDPSAADDSPSAADGPPSAGAGHPSAADGLRDRSSTDKNQIEKTSSSLAIVERPDVEKICRHLADRIADNGSKRPRITKTWRDEARRLIDLDGKSVEQIIRAIDWCQDHSFWRANIMSMPALREKYDRLRLEAQRGSGSNGHKQSTTDLRVAAGLELYTKYAAEEAK